MYNIVFVFFFFSDELFYSWYKVGGSLPGNSILMDHNRVILIQDLELVHAGEYICSVERQNGLETTGSVTLTIDGEHGISTLS